MSFPPRPPMGLPVPGRIIPPAFGYAPMGSYHFAALINMLHMCLLTSSTSSWFQYSHCYVVGKVTVHLPMYSFVSVFLLTM